MTRTNDISPVQFQIQRQKDLLVSTKEQLHRKSYFFLILPFVLFRPRDEEAGGFREHKANFKSCHVWDYRDLVGSKEAQNKSILDT